MEISTESENEDNEAEERYEDINNLSSTAQLRSQEAETSRIQVLASTFILGYRFF